MNIDKSIKKMLGHTSSIKKNITAPKSPAVRGKLLQTGSFSKKILNKLMGDFDKDKVNNIMDCKPFNRKKQGFGEEAGVPIVDYPQSYGYKRTKRMISPNEFLDYTRQQSLLTTNWGKEKGYEYLQNPKTYEKAVIMPTNVARLKPIIKSSKGKMSVPWIETKRGVPVEHEGRHRAVAAREVGYSKIPVYFVETDKEYIGQNWEDNDGDGVINVEDCEPNNPEKQGVVHDIYSSVKDFWFPEKPVIKDVKPTFVQDYTGMCKMYNWRDNDNDGIINAEDCKPNNPYKQGPIHEPEFINPGGSGASLYNAIEKYTYDYVLYYLNRNEQIDYERLKNILQQRFELTSDEAQDIVEDVEKEVENSEPVDKDKPPTTYFIERDGISYRFRTRQFYQDIAEQARMNVKVKYGNKRYALLKKKIARDYESLKGYCRDVSDEVKEILDRNRIPSKLILVKSPVGGSHYAVEVLDDNVIVDATINQYIPGNYKYVYEAQEYPFERWYYE